MNTKDHVIKTNDNDTKAKGVVVKIEGVAINQDNCATKKFKRSYLYTCEYSDIKESKGCQHHFHGECTVFVSGDSCPFQRDGGSLADLLNKLMGGQ